MMRRILFVVLTLSLSTPVWAIIIPPWATAPDELRNGFASLTAVPGVPDAFKVNFNDDEVALRAVTVQPVSVPEGGSCRVEVLINNLLAKVMITEPPVGIVEDHPVSLTWHALLGRFGIDQPPSAIVLTPEDGLTIRLESTAADAKDTACRANVLVLGSVYTEALAGEVTPVSPKALRSEYLRLKATPDLPGEQKLSFSDDAVRVASFDVIPTQTSEAGECVIRARINELLARIQRVEPPTAIAGIVQPPDAIVNLDGVTLAGYVQPPTAIVFKPKDVLKVELRSELRGKEKDKDSTCAADVLILGVDVSDGQ
jgi:hypothetical protein